MKRKAIGVILIGVAVVGTLGVCGIFLKKRGQAEQSAEAAASRGAAKTAQKATAGGAGKAAQAGGVKQPGGGVLANTGGGSQTNGVLPAAVRALSDKMQKLLDDGDESGAQTVARQLMGSEYSEVRRDVIAVFGWVGVKALPDLSRMLADPDPDVARDAFEHWKRAVSEVADDASKAELLTAGMSVLASQSDLEACVMEFDSLPDALAVRGLVTLIQSENRVASEVAREHFEFVTGEPYVSPTASEAWIKKSQE